MPQSEDIQAFIERWDQSFVDTEAFLRAIRATFPDCAPEIRSALETVAHGPPSTASCGSAAALCSLAGIGDPLETADQRFNNSEELTDPQWLLWIAGYSYNWICNSGLSACYFDFDDRQYADRIRVYEVIGAPTAAAVLREADQRLGIHSSPDGRFTGDVEEAFKVLDELSPKFWDCGDEIFTRAFLYALEHAEHF